MPSLLQTWALPIALLAIATLSGTWYTLISQHVPDPYLDEVFHVPQAQKYCKKDYSWDPKITTPPGLYLASLLLEPLIRTCDTSALRALNAGAICIVCLLAFDTLQYLNRASSKQKERGNKRVAPQEATVNGQTSLLNAHSALNISLFPPLFFFSGLYYTDVMSTLAVLLSYNVFLRTGKGKRTFWEAFALVLIGIITLSFRQTNIFWVAVFPAGLTVVDALKDDASKPADAAKQDTPSILKKSWTEGQVYDCSIQEANLVDCILLSLSIGLGTLSKPFLVLKAVSPYLVLLGLFAGFVAWNGGVVLGDKSNHVATLHLPQMLYLWPYIVFFSLPLTLVSILPPVIRLSPEGPLKAFCQNALVGSSKISAPGIFSTLLFIVSGLAAVHFNTIVHPFTLADNRHYVFYVFRILRRHAAIKYLAVPFYYMCTWMTIQTLGPVSQEDKGGRQNREKVHPTNSEMDRQPCQISFIIVWLATTALSVITAPLVEPRYFIIPWIIWRLHVPIIAASPSSNRSTRKASYDIRLALETGWLLVVNAVLAYNFLYRGFLWPSEPGKIQRFLW